MGDVPGHEDRPIPDLSPSTAKMAKAVVKAMEGTQEFVHEQRADIEAFVDRIGMRPGTELEVAGSVLGSFIGGGIAHGTPPGAWPDALMKMLVAPREQAIRDFALPSVDPVWVRCIAGIVWEAMQVVVLALRKDADAAVAIRNYLDLLCHTVGSMMDSLQQARSE